MRSDESQQKSQSQTVRLSVRSEETVQRLSWGNMCPLPTHMQRVGERREAIAEGCRQLSLHLFFCEVHTTKPRTPFFEPCWKTNWPRLLSIAWHRHELCTLLMRWYRYGHGCCCCWTALIAKSSGQMVNGHSVTVPIDVQRMRRRGRQSQGSKLVEYASLQVSVPMSH